jgi:hypothetical protein
MLHVARTALALTFLAISLAAAQAADDKVDISGTWNAEVDLGGMQGTPTFTFKQDGEKLTGKYKGQFGDAELTGKIKGKDIEFSFEIQPGAKATYTGTIDKDTMKGNANYADQASGTWTAKKAEKK